MSLGEILRRMGILQLAFPLCLGKIGEARPQ